MNTSSFSWLQILKVLSWVIFIGLCIKTGALLFSFFISLFINEGAASDLYKGLDLSALLSFSRPTYLFLVIFLILLWGLQAYLFYLVIRMFGFVNLSEPFTRAVAGFVGKMSVVAFITGLLAWVAKAYTHHLAAGGIKLPGLAENWHTGIAYLFFGAMLLAIGKIFEKGVALQSENALTI